MADINAAGSFQQAAAAGAAGDAPVNGGNNTVGGTTEGRAQDVLSELGAEANQYSPDAAADQEADQILQEGEQQFQPDMQQQLDSWFLHPNDEHKQPQ